MNYDVFEVVCCRFFCMWEKVVKHRQFLNTILNIKYLKKLRFWIWISVSASFFSSLQDFEEIFSSAHQGDCILQRFKQININKCPYLVNLVVRVQHFNQNCDDDGLISFPGIYGYWALQVNLHGNWTAVVSHLSLSSTNKFEPV